MLYKYGGEGNVILPLNFDLLKFYLARKKIESWSIFKPKGKGKTKTKPKFFVLHGYASQLISVNNMISLCFLFRILLKKF